MSPNNETLLNGVLRLKLLDNPFGFCSFINLVFLVLYTAHFNDKNVLLSLVFKTLESTPSVFYYTLNKMSICFIT